MSDPTPIIQGILQTGHDLRPLRDELYCQLIKQTNKVPHPGSVDNLCSWQILTCLSCTFLPSRGILKYLKFHLRRYEWPGRCCSRRGCGGHGSDKLDLEQKTPCVGRAPRSPKLAYGAQTTFFSLSHTGLIQGQVPLGPEV